MTDDSEPVTDKGHLLLDDDYFQRWRSRPEVVEHDQWSLRNRMYFGQDGEPIPYSEWTRAFYDLQARRIGDDHIDELYRVSTVWLGIDYSFGLGGPPLIFETIVFFAGTYEQAGVLDRYSTRDEALAGHEAICAELRATTDRAAAQEQFRVYPEISEGPQDTP